MTRWEDRELDLRGALDEVARLLRRARRRKGLVLLLTLVLTALLTVREVRRQKEYPASIALSATEGQDTENAVAHTSGKLVDYIYYAVLTDGTLTALMDRFEFRPDLREKNPRLRLETFRDAIDITVYKNEFTQPRYPGSPARSARIGLEFRHTDPQTALDIARALGDLVIERDAQNRHERIVAQQKTANESLSYAEAEVARLTRELASARSGLESGDGDIGALRVQEMSAKKGLEEASLRLKEAADAKQKLELTRSSDQRSLELRYDRVDWGYAKPKGKLWTALVKTGVSGFFVFLWLVALIVAAFDPRIYDDLEVRRLGLRSLGFVRPSRGM